MPSDIERGIDQEQVEDQFETEFGKIGKELPIEYKDFFDYERKEIKRAEDNYRSYGEIYYCTVEGRKSSREGFPLLSPRSSKIPSESYNDNVVIRQHYADKDSL